MTCSSASSLLHALSRRPAVFMNSHLDIQAFSAGGNIMILTYVWYLETLLAEAASSSDEEDEDAAEVGGKEEAKAEEAEDEVEDEFNPFECDFSAS